MKNVRKYTQTGGVNICVIIVSFVVAFLIL